MSLEKRYKHLPSECFDINFVFLLIKDQYLKLFSLFWGVFGSDLE